MGEHQLEGVGHHAPAGVEQIAHQVCRLRRSSEQLRVYGDLVAEPELCGIADVMLEGEHPESALGTVGIVDARGHAQVVRCPGSSEEHTSELQSLMRNSYADFCLNKK